MYTVTLTHLEPQSHSGISRMTDTLHFKVINQIVGKW